MRKSHAQIIEAVGVGLPSMSMMRSNWPLANSKALPVYGSSRHCSEGRPEPLLSGIEAWRSSTSFVNETELVPRVLNVRKDIPAFVPVFSLCLAEDGALQSSPTRCAPNIDALPIAVRNRLASD